MRDINFTVSAENSSDKIGSGWGTCSDWVVSKTFCKNYMQAWVTISSPQNEFSIGRGIWHTGRAGTEALRLDWLEIFEKYTKKPWVSTDGQGTVAEDEVGERRACSSKIFVV